MVRSVLAIAIALLLSATAAEARAHAPVSSHAMLHTCCTTPAMAERLFAESKAMGARFIRVDVELSGIFETAGGSPEDPVWERLDRIMELSRRHRLPVLGILLNTPAWLSACPGAGAGAVRCAPSDMDEFGRLAGEVAAHARGTIAHWEIVNEPDAGWAFSGTAEDYARMLRAAHDAIKSRVPEARVVLGGIAAPHDPGWIGRVLATPGARAAHAFDIANVHLRGSAAGVAGQLASWRDLLARHGFGGPVWVTEHGYAGDPAHQSDVAFRGGEPAQAAYLTQSLLGLGEAGASEVFVTLRDNLDGAFASEGVVDVEEAPGHAARRKPAFAAVRRLVDRWDELIAARAAQRRHEASAGVETERALAWERAARAARPALAQARARLRALRAGYARARRAPVRARLAREVARANKRVIRRKAHVGWPKAVAADYRLRAALHSRRAFDLAVWVARG